MNEETKLILECLRELLLDSKGENIPTRKMLVGLIDINLNPKENLELSKERENALGEKTE